MGHLAAQSVELETLDLGVEFEPRVGCTDYLKIGKILKKKADKGTVYLW